MTTYRVRNLLFDQVTTEITLEPDHCAVLPRYTPPRCEPTYTRTQAERLLAAYRELAQRMPDTWALEQEDCPPRGS